VREGVCPDATTLVNDVMRSLSEHQQRAFVPTPELEAWLLEAADSPATPPIGSAPPASYEVNGRQFIVIPATGGGKLETPTGDAYVAFAIPQ